MANDIERGFDEAMMEIYRRARDEVKYNATRFLGMLHDHRGLETARILINAPTVSDGYTAMWDRKRMDLTVEAIALKPEFASLFTAEELMRARQRLADYRYTAPWDAARG